VDGNTAIIGGPYDNLVVNDGAGAAWIFTRQGSSWSQQAKLVGTGATGNANQGWSVSLSGDGDTAVVGGFNDNDAAGAAWIFTRQGSSWSQQAKLVGTGATSNAEQGFSVSLSADGNTAIVGGLNDQNGAEFGSTWVFTRTGKVWSQQGPKLVATDATGSAAQGFAVSLSANGNAAVVGGPADNNGLGAAWIFTRLGEAWSQQAKLVGTDAIGPAEQGFSVSISGDGNTVVVGGPLDNGQVGTDIGVGAAWVFTRMYGVWSQQGPKLVGTGALGNPHQGHSVSVSGDGRTTLIGGPQDNTYSVTGQTDGAAWVFAQPVFAGTPGKANCHGQSVSALARQYGGLNAAAAALGYADVSTLQSAIMMFCGG